MTNANDRERAASREIARKARRLARTRASHSGLWRQLAASSALGLLFILPVLAGAMIARGVRAKTEIRALVLLPVTAGVLMGGYLVYRQIRKELPRGDDDD